MEEMIGQFGRIGVLMGGCSSERDISLKSGQAIHDALEEAGLDTAALDITTREENEILKVIFKADIDIAFIALHGTFGEDGTMQSILEKANIPYTGSGVEASRVAINKILTQNLLKKNNISVPNYVSLTDDRDLPTETILRELGCFPLVVKPAREGSSIGISIVKDAEELASAISLARRHGRDVLVERHIKGKELTVGIVGDQSLPVLEIRPRFAFFDYQAKYEKGLTEYVVPAPMPEETARKLRENALAVHRIVGCSGFSRVDFIMDDEGRDYVLEVNTIPGFTATSLLPKAAAAMGMDFTSLCTTILQLAYAEKKKNKEIPLRR